MVPDCELLLLGGDYSPNPQDEYWWLKDTFWSWLKSVEERGIKIVGVAGNHDLLFEKKPEIISSLYLPWTYLQDSFTIWNGQKIYGSPWQPRFYDWAFNLDEPDLMRKWSLIPSDTDILLLHAPPLGCRDMSSRKERIGSPSLLQRINEIRPRLVVFGHNHAGYGRGVIKHLKTGSETVVVNAAHMNDMYQPVNDPVLIEFHDKT